VHQVAAGASPHANESGQGIAEEDYSEGLRQLCEYISVSVCEYNCMKLCVYVYACVYVCMCICMYVCKYVCMYVCMYVYVYLKTCMQILQMHIIARMLLLKNGCRCLTTDLYYTQQ